MPGYSGGSSGGGGLSAPVALTDLATQAEATIVGRAAGAGTGVPVALTPAQARLIGSVLRKSAFEKFTTIVSTSANTPYDNTIPQRTTETVSFASLAAFTPTSADSRIRCTVIGSITNSTSGFAAVACLFKDSEASALVANFYNADAGGSYRTFALQYEFSPGSVSPITFEIRIGALNGNGTVYMPADIARFGTAAPAVFAKVEEFSP